MPQHQTDKKKLDCHQINDAVAADGTVFVASFDDLADVLPNILGFLPPKDIMRQRRVCRKCKEATKNTIVPLADFLVGIVEKSNAIKNYNALRVITRALPNLQQITSGDLGYGLKWSDGDDPDEEWDAETADWIVYDIGIISNFSKLRILNISSHAGLNGRYPFLFNSFPLLEKMRMDCKYLKFDLEMLAGMPLLKELDCWHSYGLTGNINSLRVLKDTLEKVKIYGCDNVEGNFMDLADFAHLKALNLLYTAVTGDIRDVGHNDFPSLEEVKLPSGVYGGEGYELQRISDGLDVVRAVYLFKKQRSALKMKEKQLLASIMKDWYCRLSEDSPDRYDSIEDDGDDTPPFDITFVQAGSRLGYRWETDCGNPCEVNWLDPEPDRDSSDYDEYIEELQQIREANQYRGFYQPPTEEEYNRLLESMGMSNW